MALIRYRWLAPLLALALLAACGQNHDGAASGHASATPAKSVLSSIHLLQKGQFDALLQQLLPPAEYRRMRAFWTARHARLGQASARDRARFARAMAELTAPDANQRIWSRIQAKLRQMDPQTRARLPLMIGMGQLMLSTRISQADQLSPDQKQQAGDVLEAVGSWAQKTDWTDQDRIRRVVGVVTATARKLDLGTLDQVAALDYAQAMRKYAVVWSGLKQALDVYGLSLDQTLDSVTARTLQSDAHTATVRVDYTLLGKPQHLTVDMIRIDNHWYDKDLLDHWRKALQRAAPAPAVSAAAAAGKPAPPVSAPRPPVAHRG